MFQGVSSADEFAERLCVPPEAINLDSTITSAADSSTKGMSHVRRREVMATRQRLDAAEARVASASAMADAMEA